MRSICRRLESLRCFTALRFVQHDIDGSTLEALFCKLKSLEDVPDSAICLISRSKFEINAARISARIIMSSVEEDIFLTFYKN